MTCLLAYYTFVVPYLEGCDPYFFTIEEQNIIYLVGHNDFYWHIYIRGSRTFKAVTQIWVKISKASREDGVLYVSLIAT